MTAPGRDPFPESVGYGAGQAAESGAPRDALARIIDPEAFEHHAMTWKPKPGGFPSNWQHRRDEAYRKADQVAALLAVRAQATPEPAPLLKLAPFLADEIRMYGHAHGSWLPIDLARHLARRIKERDLSLPDSEADR